MRLLFSFLCVVLAFIFMRHATLKYLNRGQEPSEAELVKVKVLDFSWEKNLITSFILLVVGYLISLTSWVAREGGYQLIWSTVAFSLIVWVRHLILHHHRRHR